MLCDDRAKEIMRATQYLERKTSEKVERVVIWVTIALSVLSICLIVLISW